MSIWIVICYSKKALSFYLLLSRNYEQVSGVLLFAGSENMNTVDSRRSSRNKGENVQDPSVSSTSFEISQLGSEQITIENPAPRPRIHTRFSSTCSLFSFNKYWPCFVITLTVSNNFLITDAVSNTSGTSDLSTSNALVLVVIIFISSLLALGLLYRQFPDLEE